MELTITHRNVGVSPFVSQFAQRKLERVERLLDRSVKATLTLSVENVAQKNRRQTAELTMYVGGQHLYMSESSPSLYAAIDVLADKLSQRIRERTGRRGRYGCPKRDTVLP